MNIHNYYLQIFIDIYIDEPEGLPSLASGLLFTVNRQFPLLYKLRKKVLPPQLPQSYDTCKPHPK